jgi:hypothetical protein
MMDFVIDKKALDSAMKQVLFGRSGSEDLVDLRVERSMLTLIAMGTNVAVPVTSDASESVSVSITVSDLAKLKKVSATYKAGPVRIRIGGGRIRFQNTSIGVSASEATSARRVIDIPNDASVLDLFSLPAIFSAQEIEQCGLQARVQKAKDSVAGTLQSAVSTMGEFGFTRAEVFAMTEIKLESHAATMRRVLFPTEDILEGSDEQSVESNTKCFEEPEPGGIEMNEAEMKAELERLRTENAQLKTKEKSAISLKVSDKGAVSLYGMGRFPVTLYKEQWLRVLASAPQIEAFIRENEAKLKTKE